MTDYYLIKIVVVFTVLYGIYRLCFYKLQFHTLNRFYLLLIIPLSFCLPFINIELLNTSFMINDIYEVESNNVNTPLVNSDLLSETQPHHQNEVIFIKFNWVFSCIYVLGLCIFLFRFTRGIMKLYSFKHHKKIIKKDGKFSIYKSDTSSSFSYFNNIYIPDEHIESSILFHEKLHGHLKHTYDLILVELYSSLFWFNPLVYFFKNDVKLTHEYQVDSYVLNSDVSKLDYLKLILEDLEMINKQEFMCNYFNSSTIKKRVLMMTKKKQSKQKMNRYLITVPVITMIIISYSFINRRDVKPSMTPIKLSELTSVSADFGYHTHPVLKVQKLHAGLDLKAPIGTPIYATANGVVTIAEFDNSRGNYVVITHGKHYRTLYAHMSSMKTSPGNEVKKGDLIGFVGNTGRSTGAHLHYEVHHHGKPDNPNKYF